MVMVTSMGRMGSTPIPPVKVIVIINTVLKFNGLNAGEGSYE